MLPFCASSEEALSFCRDLGQQYLRTYQVYQRFFDRIMASPPAIEAPDSPLGTIKVAFDRKRVYELAKSLADDNRFYFECISSSQFRHRFAKSCENVSRNLTLVDSISDVFCSKMPKFDFDDSTPGNGYRSVAAVMDSCVLHSIRLFKEIKEQRDSVLFRANHFSKELEAYSSVLDALRRDLETVQNYVALWTEGDLFPPDQAKPKLKSLMTIIESYDHSCFYGRCMGFQYCSSLYPVFQVIGVSLASYSLVWENGGISDSWSGLAHNLFKSGRFMLNPEERSRRISDIITNADISFCKQFWSLTESPLLMELPKWFCPTLAVNEIWTIPCQESLILESRSGKKLKITPPSAHSGPKPLPLRVMTMYPREGMPSKSSNGKPVAPEKLARKSRYLLFHCHGGGFVATSSKTHEVYLRHWAKLLDCTVVSVDYSLAPENPYPRALEEVLYAYAWVLNHPDQFGWTGERICFAGDSAGAHLLTATVFRCIQMNVKRLPDGVVLIYAPFLVEYNPSPSRLLTFLDPLLPPGILARCIAAYIGEKEPAGDVNSRRTSAENSPTNGRPKLVNYAANLKKDKHSASVPVAGKICEDDDDEIISFCQITKPSPQNSSFASTNDTNSVFNSPPKFLSGTDAEDSEDNDDDDDDEITGDSEQKEINSLDSPAAKIAALKRKSMDNSKSPTESGKFLATRQRSLSDPLQDSTNGGQSAATKSRKSTVSIPDETVHQEMTTVLIQKDPNRIFLSSSAYDQLFIDYISQHELTKRSLVRLKVPSPARPIPNRPGATKLSTSGSPATPGTPEGPPSAKFPKVDRRNLASHVRSYSTGSLSSVSQAIGSGIGTVTGYAMEALSVFLDSSSHSNKSSEPSVDGTSSKLSVFHSLEVPKDPCLSPLCARDEILAKLPPIALIACHLDPLLDDSITFGKMLRKNNVPVTLDILDSLPHGFLNFTLYSAECRDGSKLCISRIRQMLGMDDED